MKRLDACSGPWMGFSVQHSLRINEKLQMRIGEGRIHGTGTDMDGEFVMDGEYDGEDNVSMVRRYTLALDRRTGRPKSDFMAVLVHYDYTGRWDGEMIVGHWEIGAGGAGPDGGPFEMWPYREEDRLEIAMTEDELTGTR